MQSNLVSIIMPAFNAEKTIFDSITSVINQSYKNWELIVVDDNSNDKSCDIVNGFNDARVRLLGNDFAKGAAGARKTAINASLGRYIAFLDSDDIWLSNKLEIQISFMKNNNIAFLYSDYHIFNDNPDDILSTFKAPKCLSYNDLLKSCSIGCLTVVLDKFCFYDLEYPIAPKEDYVYWLHLLKQIDYAYNVGKITSCYRVGGQSLSSNKLKEVARQWFVIRNIEKVGILEAVYYIFTYAISGFFKYRN